ncbi:MAG: hypothetical protein ACI9D0_000919 [Bacteroidia bacterium]|jgi:hypothetical protein
MQLFRPSCLSLLAAAFLSLAANQVEDKSPQSPAYSGPSPALVDRLVTNSKQTFLLVPRGQPWQSNRQELGRAHLVATGSPRLLEFDLELTESGTHIQRTLRHRASGPSTLVYREWRRRGIAGQTGRSLVLEGLPTPGTKGESLLREWAGGGVRHQKLSTPADGITWLAWIEQERANRSELPKASRLSIFSDQECKWTRALVVRTNLGPMGSLRIVDLLPLDGSRNSRLVFAGDRLLGFLEGDLEGVLVSAVTRNAVDPSPNL